MVNREYDPRLCIIMTISLIIGAILIVIAKKVEVLLYLYIISDNISLLMLYSLPKKLYNKFDKNKLEKLRYDGIVLLFIMGFGPISTIFIIASTFKKKKDRLEKSNATI